MPMGEVGTMSPDASKLKRSGWVPYTSSYGTTSWQVLRGELKRTLWRRLPTLLTTRPFAPTPPGLHACSEQGDCAMLPCSDPADGETRKLSSADGLPYGA